MVHWREIKVITEWQEVLEASVNKPVLVFKHSTSCPISAGAWQECQTHLIQGPQEGVEYIIVKVIEARPVSNQIATDLEVKHESPQIILVDKKKAIWYTSHWSIKADQIKKILQKIFA